MISKNEKLFWYYIFDNFILSYSFLFFCRLKIVDKILIGFNKRYIMKNLNFENSI